MRGVIRAFFYDFFLFLWKYHRTAKINNKIIENGNTATIATMVPLRISTRSCIDSLKL